MRTSILVISALILILFSTCKKDEDNNGSASYFIKVTMDGVNYEFTNFQLNEYNAITKSISLSVATTAFVADVHINDIETFSAIATGNFEAGGGVCLSGFEIFRLGALAGYSSVTDMGSNKFVRVSAVNSIDADNVEITGTVDDLEVLGISPSGDDTVMLTNISFHAKVTNKHPNTGSLDYISAKVNNVTKTFYTNGISRYDYDSPSEADELWLTANIDEQDGTTEKRGFTLIIDDLYWPPVTGTWDGTGGSNMMYSTYDLRDCSRNDYDSREQNGNFTITISSVTPSGNGYLLEGTFSGKVSRYHIVCCETLNVTSGEFRIKI